MGGLHEETELYLDDHFRRAQQMAERFKHATVGIKHFGGREPTARAPVQECAIALKAPEKTQAAEKPKAGKGEAGKKRKSGASAGASRMIIGMKPKANEITKYHLTGVRVDNPHV